MRHVSVTYWTALDNQCWFKFEWSKKFSNLESFNNIKWFLDEQCNEPLRQCFPYIVRRALASALDIFRLLLLCAVIAFVRGLSIGNSMISSDIWHKYYEWYSKLLYVISRAVRRVKFETILKCHEWCLCQISRTNHAIIGLYYYPQNVCNFYM